MPKYKNITMPDSLGYQVRVVRNGDEHSRYFSFAVWGGKKKALDAAVNWRDMMKARLGEPRRFEGEARNNSTGVRGVSKVIHEDKRRGHSNLRYQVTWTKEDGKQAARTFQVGRVGEISADEELHAYRTAVAFRKKYELARSLGQRFDPAEFVNWKLEKLY